MHTLAGPSRPQHGDEIAIIPGWTETPVEILGELELFQDELVFDESRYLIFVGRILNTGP